MWASSYFDSIQKKKKINVSPIMVIQEIKKKQFAFEQFENFNIWYMFVWLSSLAQISH